MSDRFARGLARMKDILGEKTTADLQAKFAEFSPDFGRYVTEIAYGEFYAREAFDDKTRELAAVACLIGQGNPQAALKSHLKGMMRAGWQQSEIIELIMFLIPYVGFPRSVEALYLFKEILDAQKARAA